MIGVCALLLAFAISGSATSVPYKVAKVSAEATKTTNWYLQPPPSQYSLLAPEFEVDQNSKATLIPQQAKWQAGLLTFICGVSISVYGAVSLWFSRQAQESQRLLDIEIGMSAWLETQDAFSQCMDESKKINTLKFVAACRAIAKIYDALFVGMVAGQLKGDILNSSATIEKVFLKNPDKCETLQDMVAFELKTRGKEVVRADKTSGIVGLLWSKRATDFITTYLNLLATKDDMTAPKCAQMTYETVLMKYHGWLTSKMISAVMNLAPSKQDIFSKLGVSGEPKVAIAEFVGILHPIIGEVQGLLASNDCDFPDKV